MYRCKFISYSSSFLSPCLICVTMLNSAFLIVGKTSCFMRSTAIGPFVDLSNKQTKLTVMIPASTIFAKDTTTVFGFFAILMVACQMALLLLLCLTYQFFRFPQSSMFCVCLVWSTPRSSQFSWCWISGIYLHQKTSLMTLFDCNDCVWSWFLNSLAKQT